MVSAAVPAAAETGFALKVPGWKIFSRPVSLGRVEVQVVEKLLAPGHGAAGQAAGDDLGVGAHVGRDAEMPLRAAGSDAETGYHLVEDQHHAVLRRELPQEAKELGGVGHEPEGAAVGSSMAAAISSSASKAARAASLSPGGSRITWDARSGSTPAVGAPSKWDM